MDEFRNLQNNRLCVNDEPSSKSISRPNMQPFTFFQDVFLLKQYFSVIEKVDSNWGGTSGFVETSDVSLLIQNSQNDEKMLHAVTDSWT